MTLIDELEILHRKIAFAIAALDQIRLDTVTKDVIAAEISLVRRVLVEAKRQPKKRGLSRETTGQG
jgi:hypothetical protein